MLIDLRCVSNGLLPGLKLRFLRNTLRNEHQISHRRAGIRRQHRPCRYRRIDDSIAIPARRESDQQETSPKISFSKNCVKLGSKGANVGKVLDEDAS